MRLGEKGEQKAGVPAVELQQDVQRLVGQFTSRIGQAGVMVSQSVGPEKQLPVLNQVLLYDSSAIDIATGRLPEVNLVDLIVFLELCSNALERYWIPEVFGPPGEVFTEAFARTRRDAWRTAGKVMDASLQQQLRNLITQWEAENPGQVRVEGVRFTDFSARAGKVAEEQAQQTRGLLASVQGATAAADQALLLGERAMFLVQRMPFLLRLQARVGAQELFSDTLQELGSAQEAFAKFPGQVGPLVQDTSFLMTQSGEAARQTRLLIDSLKPIIDTIKAQPELPKQVGQDASQVVGTANELAARTLEVLRELRTLAPSREGGADPLTVATERIDKMVRRWFFYLALLALLTATFLWGGYFIAKRLLQRSAPQAPPSPPRQDRPDGRAQPGPPSSPG